MTPALLGLPIAIPFSPACTELPIPIAPSSERFWLVPNDMLS